MDNRIYGHGSGFYQVEQSHRHDDKFADVSDLRTHAKKAKHVMAQLIKNNLPAQVAGVAQPNPQAVAGNVKAKIYSPTRGGAAVQFLDTDENKKASMFCRKIQNTLAEKFGKTSPQQMKENADEVPSTAIVPIENLHVTALAMGVVDAVNEEDYNEKLVNNKAYRAVFEYFQQHPEIGSINIGGEDFDRNRLLNSIAVQQHPIDFIKDKFSDGEVSEEIIAIIQEETSQASEKFESFLESGGAVFNVIDLKITDNGSVVLQMAANNDLIQVKEGLVKLGGIAKGTLGNLTASTIGYIPKFDKITQDEKEALSNVISGLRNELIEQGLTIQMNNLTLVQFKVNSLAPDVIEKQLLSSQSELKHLTFKYLD